MSIIVGHTKELPIVMCMMIKIQIQHFNAKNVEMKYYRNLMSWENFRMLDICTIYKTKYVYQGK